MFKKFKDILALRPFSFEIYEKTQALIYGVITCGWDGVSYKNLQHK